MEERKRLNLAQLGRDYLMVRHNSIQHYLYAYTSFGDDKSLEEIHFHLKKMLEAIRKLKKMSKENPDYDSLH